MQQIMSIENDNRNCDCNNNNSMMLYNNSNNNNFQEANQPVALNNTWEICDNMNTCCQDESMRKTRNA